MRWLGRVGYADAVELQEQTRATVLERIGAAIAEPSLDLGEAVLLLEHPHVFTLGRNAQREDVLATDAWLEEHGVEIHDSDRGGQVTYHGPGQLVGYPVLSLQPDRRDVRRYVADLMAVLIATLADFGIEARPGEGDRIGVWVEGAFGVERKIASIGVHLKRWTTTHGFALNVQPELGFFGGIVPCGLQGIELTSVARELGRRVALPEVSECLVPHLRRRFERAQGVDPESFHTTSTGIGS